MKLLLDACVWGGAKEALAALGHDVVPIKESFAWWVSQPGVKRRLVRMHSSGTAWISHAGR